MVYPSFVFVGPFIGTPDSLRLYPVNSIVDLLSLIYSNPLCKNIMHPAPHRVLNTIQGLVFGDELLQRLAFPYG